MRPVAILAILAVVGFLAFALWYSRQHPRVIVATGTVVVTSERPKRSITLATRDVVINGVRFQEVELPGGTWIDCAGDCPAAVRQAREDFWERFDKERR